MKTENIFKDDRTEEQKKTHKMAVVGTDVFMSGWGGLKMALVLLAGLLKMGNIQKY